MSGNRHHSISGQVAVCISYSIRRRRKEGFVVARNVFVAAIVVVDWLSWASTAAAVGYHTGAYLPIIVSSRR